MMITTDQINVHVISLAQFCSEDSLCCCFLLTAACFISWRALRKLFLKNGVSVLAHQSKHHWNYAIQPFLEETFQRSASVNPVMRLWSWGWSERILNLETTVLLTIYHPALTPPSPQVNCWEPTAHSDTVKWPLSTLFLMLNWNH